MIEYPNPLHTDFKHWRKCLRWIVLPGYGLQGLHIARLWAVTFVIPSHYLKPPNRLCLEYRHSVPLFSCGNCHFGVQCRVDTIGDCTTKKCDVPSFRHGAGNLGRCRFSPSPTVLTFIKEGEPLTEFAGKASDNRQLWFLGTKDNWQGVLGFAGSDKRVEEERVTVAKRRLEGWFKLSRENWMKLRLN